MPLEIAVEKNAQTQVITLRGRLDSAAAPAAKTALDTAVDSGDLHLLLNCAELTYVSSVGLGLFINAAKTLAARGGTVAFAGLTQHVRAVFEMVGIMSMFQTYPTVEAAQSGAVGQG